MIDRESEHRLSQLLEDLGPADPPAELVNQVMARITPHGHGATERIIPFNRGGIAMTRKAMWGLATAAAIILAVLAVTGFPPVGRGTEGTIGAAKKYQAAQLTDQDVVLGDAEAQEFLQSEAFDRLIKDEPSRRLLSEDSVKAALNDRAFVAALTDPDIRNSLATQALGKVYANSALRAKVEAAVKSGARDEVKKDAQAALNAELNSTLASAGIMKAMQNRAVVQAMNSRDFFKVMSRVELAQALNSAAFAKAVSQRGFSAAFATSRFSSEMAGH